MSKNNLEIKTEQNNQDNNIKPPRSIRSFVKRAGKLTKGQANAIDTLWSQFGVELSDDKLHLAILFGREADNVLEIGFGNGLSLAEMAKTAPQINFFGIEVHEPGVGSLLVQVAKQGLSNIRVSRDDAVSVIQKQIAHNSIDRVQIFFPDPWHKKRHHKRRLIQADFVAQLVGILKPNGVIHVATDWENYAEHILEVLQANPNLASTQGTLLSGYRQRPDYRPQTKYETRGQRLGHGVWDIVFSKC